MEAFREEQKLCPTVTSYSHEQELQHDIRSNSSTEVASDSSTSSDCGHDECDGDEFDVTLAVFSVEETIIILDWDDTMLPSTWLQEQGIDLEQESAPTPAQQAQLQLMAQAALETLRVAKCFGRVILVTNAEHGWIELSCCKFMPELYTALQDVKIISARSTYEQCGIVRPLEWKYYAFKEEITGLCDTLPISRWKNMISVGDSMHEREALIRVTENVPNCCTKSVKLAEKPNMEQLLKQHELISACLEDIVHHIGSLDLNIA